MKTIDLIAACCLCVASVMPALGQDRLLTVTGRGEVSAAPDQADISVGVESADRTAGGALASSSEVMAALIPALEAAGVATSDIQTSHLSLRPRYADRRTGDAPPQILGFVASADLRVRVRDLGAVGAVMDVLTGEGANRLGGISFGIAAPEPLLDAARTQAVGDAMRKAALMAEAAGVTLGKIRTIREGSGGGGPIPQPFARAEMAAASMPVAAGELTLSATVTLEFEIE